MTLALRDEDADEAGSEHGIVINPGMDLGKQAGAVAAGGAEELALAARVEARVRRHVIHFAAERGPGVAAAAPVLRC